MFPFDIKLNYLRDIDMPDVYHAILHMTKYRVS